MSSALKALLLSSLFGCARPVSEATKLQMTVEGMCRLADGVQGAAIVDLTAVRDLANSAVEPQSIGRKIWWRPSLLPDSRMRVSQWKSGVTGIFFPALDGYDSVWFGVGSFGVEGLARLVPTLDRTSGSADPTNRVLTVSFSSVATTSTYCRSEGRVVLLGTSDVPVAGSSCVPVPFELRPEEILSFGASPKGSQIPADRAAVDAADGVATFGPGTPLFWMHEPNYGPAVPVACGRL